MNRRVSRIIAMKILYNQEINPQDNFNEIIESAALKTEVDYILEASEDENLTNEADNISFIKELIVGVVKNGPIIDAKISENLENWSISRLSYVDRAIIRIATYEMLLTNTPHTVIIDEALEITKMYANLDDGAQSRFTNRLLDRISGGIKRE